MIIDFSANQINDCIVRFDQEEGLKERILELSFKKTLHISQETALIRVTLLNTFYSTRLNNTIPDSDDKTDETKKPMIDVMSMAERIAGEPDLYIKMTGNEDEKFEAIRYIAKGKNTKEKTGEENWDTRFKDAWSFASKYCSFCCPNSYPIMDRYSKGMLYRIAKQIEKDKHQQLGGRTYTKKDMDDYKTFCEVHRAFRALINKTLGIEYTTKDIDKYLWYYGKKYNIDIERAFK